MYGSQQLLSSGINGFTNSASEKTLRLIRQENLIRIIIAHLNINSIRNKLDLLPNQVIGNVLTIQTEILSQTIWTLSKEV